LTCRTPEHYVYPTFHTSYLAPAARFGPDRPTKENTELMKKADLVDLVAQQRGFPRPQVEATIDSLIDAVAEGLAKGERIDLRGFGAFAVRESAARTGRNPQTGEAIQIAARRVPTFKAGKELRDRVNRPSS
jgi:DNA-binding protein HU-beta